MDVSSRRREINDLKVILTEVNGKMDIISDLKKEVESLKESLNFISNKYDDIIIRMNCYEKENKDLKSEIENLGLQNKDLKSDLDVFSKDKLKIEQEINAKIVEFHGLYKQEQEDVLGVIANMANKLEVDNYNSDQILLASRINRRNITNKPSILQIKFKSTLFAQNWLKKRRNLLVNSDLFTDLDESQKQQRIYINEYLSFECKRLFWKTKEAAKIKNYKFVWIKNGKIFCRKEEKSKIVLIASLNDIELL